MEFKKLIFIFVIATIIVVGLLFSFSYAFYVASPASATRFTTATTPNLDVVFSNTSNINTEIGQPIYSADVETKASSNIFSVTVGNEFSGHPIAIKVSLINVVIDDVLKDSNFKWQFLRDGISIANGNFSGFSGTTLELQALTDMNIDTYPKTYNYVLRIWLEEICSDLDDITSCSDYSAWQAANTAGTETYPYNSPLSTTYGQNRMMGKSFSGRIEVTSAFK